MAYFKCGCDGGGSGTPGADGLDILSGHGVPGDGLGRVGEFYLDLDTYILYGPKENDGTPWSNLALLLGAPGINGTSILHGSGLPTGGADGDFWLNLNDYRLYGPKAGGSWPGTGTLLIGAPGAPGQNALWNWRGEYENGAEYNIGDLVYHPASGSSYYRSGDPLNQGYAPPDPVRWSLIAAKGDDGAAGADGNTILNFPAGPTTPGDDLVGNDGDFWLDTAGYVLYGPKSGTWPVSGHPLTGSAGAAGSKIWHGSNFDVFGVIEQGAAIGDYFLDIVSPYTLHGPKLAADWNNAVSLVLEGADGDPGSDGTIIHSGDGAPVATYAEGDFYLDLTNKNLWGPADVSGVLSSYINLTGLTGSTGAPGSQIYVQSTQPVGVDGDVWIDNTTGFLYGPKAAGSWNLSSWVDLTGPAGARGSTVWNGITTPDAAVIDGSVGGGAFGDFFINTAATAGPTMYGPRGVTSWNLATAVVLKGDKGDTGSFGGAVFQYKFDSTAPIYGTASQPAVGYFNVSQLASGSPSNKTLCIHQTTSLGADVSAYLQTIDDSTSAVKGHVKFEKAGDPTVFQYYAIVNFHTELPVVPTTSPATVFFRVPVALLSSNGTFSNNDTINATFVRTGDKGDAGTGGVVAVRGAYHSEVTQTPTITGGVIQPTAMTFPVADLVAAEVTLDITNSKLIVPEAGTYNVQFSAQLRHPGGGVAFTNIWFKVNGTDVPKSDTKVSIASSAQYAVASWNIMLDLDQDDEVQIMWYPDHADTTLQAEAATANTPEIPSVIVTIDRLAYSGRSTYQEWLAIGNTGTEADFVAAQRGPGVWTYSTSGVAPTASNPVTGTLHNAGDYVIDSSSTNKAMWGPFSLPNTWPGPVNLVGANGTSASTPPTYSLHYGTGRSGSKSFADQAEVTAWTDGLLALFTSSGLVEYEDLTIPAGASFDTMGFPVIVHGTLYLGAGASIHADGQSASVQVAGVGRATTATAGAYYLPGNSTLPSSAYRMYGGSFSGGVGSVGTSGPGNGTGPGANDPCWAGVGGAGGAVGATQGGNAGAISTASGQFRGGATNISSPQYLSTGVMPHYFPPTWGAANWRAPQGGSGGGGGRCLTTGSNGGGGGAGAGVCVVFARNIVLLGATARISANGGNGGTGSGVAASGGGGGGGGGYVAVITTEDLDSSAFSGLSVTATGGTGGAGRNTGNNGSNGAGGLVIKYIG